MIEDRVGAQVRGNEEAGKSSALIVEGIEIRCLQPRMAVPPQRTVSLIIGHHEDDVRFCALQLRVRRTAKRKE